MIYLSLESILLVWIGIARAAEVYEVRDDTPADEVVDLMERRRFGVRVMGGSDGFVGGMMAGVGGGVGVGGRFRDALPVLGRRVVVTNYLLDELSLLLAVLPVVSLARVGGLEAVAVAVASGSVCGAVIRSFGGTRRGAEALLEAGPDGGPGEASAGPRGRRELHRKVSKPSLS